MIRYIIKNIYIKSILFVVFIIHLFFLYIYPFFQFNWTYTQNVWDRWQGIIVGDFAAISSIILYLTATHKEKNERINKLKANRVLLSKPLSDLLLYCKEIKRIYSSYYFPIVLRDFEPYKIPDFPTRHENLFYKCIEYEENQNIINHIIYIIDSLQINHSRIVSLNKSFYPTTLSQETFNSYLFELAKLTQMINMLFDYSRLTKNNIRTKITKADLHFGFKTLEIDITSYKDLENYIDIRFID